MVGLLNSINDCLTEKQHGFSDIYSISEDLDEVFFAAACILSILIHFCLFKQAMLRHLGRDPLVYISTMYAVFLWCRIVPLVFI